jgi:cholesterol oxidase
LTALTYWSFLTALGLTALGCAEQPLDELRLEEQANAPDISLRVAQSYSAKAIVIGSGYGGSVAALRLAEKGVDTLVLERGRRWTVQADGKTQAPFATMEAITANIGNPAPAPNPAADNSTWMNDRCAGNLYLTLLAAQNVPTGCSRTTGILESVDSTPETHRDLSPALKLNNIAAVVAAGVGGGSLINNGVTFAPTELAWNVAYPAAELPYMAKVWKDLNKTFFAKAKGVLGAEPPPSSLLSTPQYRATALTLQHAAAAGIPSVDTYDPATMTGVALPPVIADWSKVQQELTGERVPSVTAGEAWWGNNSAARKSLDTPQSYLGRAEATGRVTVKALHTVTGVRFDKHAKLYVVSVVRTDEAYNTLETLELTTPNLIMAAGSLGTTKLLVRSRELGGLPKLTADVGTRFSTNGNTALLRMTGETSPIGQGGLAGVRINDFREPGNPVALENLPQRVPGIPNLAPFNTAIFSIGIGIPTAKGTFHYDAPTDTVVLDWPVGGADNVYNRVVAGWESLPGAQLYPALKNVAASQRRTLHPLGGVPLGLATNKHCKLKGYKHLYAVDGSILPNASAAANPSFLITAMAERCMSKIAGSIADGADAWEDEAFDAFEAE